MKHQSLHLLHTERARSIRVTSGVGEKRYMR